MFLPLFQGVKNAYLGYENCGIFLDSIPSTTLQTQLPYKNPLQ